MPRRRYVWEMANLGDISGACKGALRPNVERRRASKAERFLAAADRTELQIEVTPDEIAAALASDEPDLRLAASLCRAAQATKNLDHEEMKRALDEATTCLPLVGEPRLRWWYYHTLAGVEAGDQNYIGACETARRAINIAESSFGLEPEWERSYANLLNYLCYSGQGHEVAATLLAYLRRKDSTALGAVFYQLTSYVLHWLGEHEFAYRLRVQSMATLRPAGARLARDAREIALLLVALGRLDEADRFGTQALELIDRCTPEEAIGTRGMAVQLAVARNDLVGATARLEEMTRFNPVGRLHGNAILAVAGLCQAHGDYDASAAWLDVLTDDRTYPDLRPERDVLLAELAWVRGEREQAIRIYDQAIEASKDRVAPADVQALICSEIGPWLAVANQASFNPTLLEVRRDHRGPWLAATARDIRQSMAPSRLILHSDAPSDEKLAALAAMVDELSLVSEFFADAAVQPDLRRREDFWATYPATKRIIARHGATLVPNPPPGHDVDLAAPGLAGRLAFGFSVVLAEHAIAGTIITVHVENKMITVQGSGLAPDSVWALLVELRQLRTQYRSGTGRVPRWAAFFVTYAEAASRGWSIEAKAPEGGRFVVTIKPSSMASDAPQAPRRRAERDQAVVAVADRAEPPTGPVELVAALVDLHERRNERPRFDFSLLDRARDHGDPDLVASALFIAASTEMFANNMDSAERLLDELHELLAANPGLEARLWPHPLFLPNRQYRLYQLRGDRVAAWIAAARSVIMSSQAQSSRARMVAVYNWTQAEIDRNALSSAWRFASMCRRSDTSARGRAFELGIRSRILLIEGRFEESAVAAVERFALERASREAQPPDVLIITAIALSKIGRFDQAWAVIEEMKRRRPTPSDADLHAVEANVLFVQGRLDEAYAACRAAKEHISLRFGGFALVTTVSIEAEVLLARGEADQAAAVLSEFAIERHRRFDLERRLDIESRVASARGDAETQLVVCRHRYQLVRGRARWEARQLPIYEEFWQAMEQAVDRERELLDAELSAVASVVTHELRNSLGAVVLSAELAEMGGDDRVLRRADRALEPIGTLADQLDAVAQWDGTSFVPKVEDVNIEGLLRTVEASNRTLCERFGSSLRIVSDVPADLSVPIERNMFEIVVSNLVGNAIKHGRPRGRVVVTAGFGEPDDHDISVVVIAVEDDGPGMPKSEADRLTAADPKAAATGGGVGLWIVRRYATLLGLDIKVRTSAMGGTRVELRLHLNAPADIDTTTLDCVDIPIVRRFGNLGTARNVLVVEDNESLSVLIVGALRELNKTVTAVSTASEALYRLDRDDFDVILADVELADGSTGYEVVAEARRRGLDDAFFIVMSGQSERQTNIDTMLRFGTTFKTLQKPFTLQALVDAVG